MAFSSSNLFLRLLSVALVAAPFDAARSQNPADASTLYTEAEAAFSEKDYATAAQKLQQLVNAVANSGNESVEMLRFNLGLAYLFQDKYAEAQTAFTDCLKQFPNGDYASRCYLGIGRAIIAEGKPEKLEQAIEALKRAATDSRFRSEAGVSLGKLYAQLDRKDDALDVFRSLTGSDIHTAQQTNAAVEVIELLADTDKIDELIPYLSTLIDQTGVRNSMAWYANQVIVRGDRLVAEAKYDAALAVYRSVPPRRLILSIQKSSLDALKRDLKILETKVEAESKRPIGQRTNAAEQLGELKSTIEMAEQALEVIEEKEDLDAALLMRRGRCLYYLNRYEEALICFRTLRTKYAEAEDASTAAYAEIAVYNQLKNPEQVQKLANEFLKKYPDAENGEQIAMLAGEALTRAGKWPEALRFYRDLEQKFPDSPHRDRYRFFQGVALFSEGSFEEAGELYVRLLQDFPETKLTEDALYRVVMANFLTNKYKETLAACREYLQRFPEGTYAGEILYRLAFIDFNDRETDQSDKILKDLGEFLEQHPEDMSAGSMLCLIGDVYSQKKKDDDKALEFYTRAIWESKTDETVQYAVQSATSILQGKKDWAGIAALHSEILEKKAGTDLALSSATWVAKMKVREGKGTEAAEILANYLKSSIADPTNEQVEPLLDELVITMMPPRRERAKTNVDELEAQLVAILDKAAAGRENPTTIARIYYSRAKLVQQFGQNDKADLYLKGIAENTQDPASLSPILLAVSGEILLKQGNLEQATAMFQRLTDRYKNSSFADAGPVGLAQIKLASKDFTGALADFETILSTSASSFRFTDATLGKLRALYELGKLDDTEKFALEIVGDRTFRGEPSGEAYLILADAYRKRAANQSGPQKQESLKKANAYYQRTYLAFPRYPEICAEAYWGSYEVLIELGERDIALETLKKLSEHPRLQNTERAKQAKQQRP